MTTTLTKNDLLRAQWVADAEFENAVDSTGLSYGDRDVFKGKSNIVAHRLGSGHVIGFSDNVNFRAFFWGTAKLLSNAVYLAPAIEAYAKPSRTKKRRMQLRQKPHTKRTQRT